MNPKVLAGLKEYAMIKQLVCNSADKTNKVDVNMMLGIIDEVDLRFKMLSLEIKSGDLEFNISEDEMYTMILYELALTEPMSVES